MLKRLYVDNYKCLVNFDFTAKPLQLILGTNGSGKSTALDALVLIRDFVTRGRQVSDLLSTETLTRWQQRDTQAFRIEVEGNGGSYVYELIVKHDRYGHRCRVEKESLSFNGNPLFAVSEGTAQLYHDDHQLGPEVTLDWNLSGVGMLGERRDNQRLAWFRHWLGNMLLVRMNPFAMSSVSEHATTHPASDMSNFASWYHNLILEFPQLLTKLNESLLEVFDGFQYLQFESAGNARVLKLAMQSDSGKPSSGNSGIAYDFAELSEGQRALIAIYTLKHYATLVPCLVCIDEPMNFVALPEIQPWLMSLCDAVEDDPSSQVMLISHHPELIDHLAPERAVTFQRERGGPTHIEPFSTADDSGLPPSELVARGWDNG